MKSSGWQAGQYTIYLICLTYPYTPRYTALKRSKFIFTNLFHLEANVVLDKDSYIGKHVGHYRIGTEISSSPIGRTYQAEHIDRKKTFVALKFFHTIHLSHQQRDLFLQDVQRYKRLKHTHLLPLLDAGIDDDVPYMVTEFVASNSLRDRLLLQPGHILPVQEAVSILTQVGQALYYMHQRNVVHGHLKPENILLREGREALLTDFSIATLTDTLTSKDIYAANTYPYMAPEQFAGWINKSSDQYALGCIAYELLTGHAPFSGTSFAAMQGKHANEKPVAPTQHNLLLPITLEQVILKAMEKNSADRYPTVQDFVIALQPSTSGYAAKSRAIEIATPAKPAPLRPPVPTLSMINPPRNAKPKMVRIDSASQSDPSLSFPVSTINATLPAQDTELKRVQPDNKLQAEIPSPLLPVAAVSVTQLEDIEAEQPSIGYLLPYQHPLSTRRNSLKALSLHWQVTLITRPPSYHRQAQHPQPMSRASQKSIMSRSRKKSIVKHSLRDHRPQLLYPHGHIVMMSSPRGKRKLHLPACFHWLKAYSLP